LFHSIKSSASYLLHQLDKLLPGERVSQVYAGNQASIAVVFIEEEQEKGA